MKPHKCQLSRQTWIVVEKFWKGDVGNSSDDDARHDRQVRTFHQLVEVLGCREAGKNLPLKMDQLVLN